MNMEGIKTRQCCCTPETMGECGDGAHVMGIFYLDGKGYDELASLKERTLSDIEEGIRQLRAIKAKLRMLQRDDEAA